MADAAANDEVHVLVVTGIGASFSAGQDLKEMAALASGTASGPHDGFPRLVDQLDTFPKPLLAAVNGDAVGIGLTMLLHCDIAVVAHDARLRVPVRSAKGQWQSRRRGQRTHRKCRRRGQQSIS